MYIISRIIKTYGIAKFLSDHIYTALKSCKALFGNFHSNRHKLLD